MNASKRIETDTLNDYATMRMVKISNPDFQQ